MAAGLQVDRHARAGGPRCEAAQRDGGGAGLHAFAVLDGPQEMYSSVVRPNTLHMLPPRTTSEGDAHKKGAYLPPGQRAKDDKGSFGWRIAAACGLSCGSQRA